ncbi:MAG: cytochrome c oxidase subunit II transmembrane domain-containing protein [Pseudomonadales bacterium]|nr:cytochrome c oxidase subunit II transmembrane domain-containing protein [Pseudomonadales bacterium]HJN53204.1 cytochrome c oxidase subunit II transmembrane domain-containing protein [Pseudomonadales bacterium]
MHKIGKFSWPSTVLLLLIWVGPLRADDDSNLIERVIPLSQETSDVHLLMFWCCVGIALVAFSVMFWSAIQHRNAGGALAAQMQYNGKAEIVWTVIPIFILIGLTIPAAKTAINMEPSAASGVSVLAQEVDKNRPGMGPDPSNGDQPLVLPGYREIRAITEPIADHLNTVLYGRTGTPMQAFGSRLADGDDGAPDSSVPAREFATVSL